MSNILITAPYLDESRTVSGISSVVKTIIENNTENNYHHFRLGKSDKQSKNVIWLLDQLWLIPKLFYSLVKYKINLIHLNVPFEKSGLLRDYVVFFIGKNIFRKKILLHIHGGYFLMQPPAQNSIYFKIIKRMLVQSTIVLVLSEIERIKIYDEYNINAISLPNSIEALKEILPEKDFDGLLNFVFLGRIVRSKGVFLLIDVLKELKSHFKDFTLSIYGAGADQTLFLDNLREIEGLNYKYYGIVKGNDKWEALKKGHIFILPSLSSEGLPMALLEAMTSGCIPISSDDASITTLVKNDINGFVMERGNKNQFKQILEKIFNNRIILPEIKQTAQQTINDHFNINNYMITLQTIIRENF